MAVEANTKTDILKSAKSALLQSGYAKLSTRGIAEAAGVPLSQIHYHFGSKKALVLAVLDEENQRLVERQKTMFSQEVPLWKRWEQAVGYLDDDLDSGYVRVLQEMTAAGWSDPEIARAVRSMLAQWIGLLTEVAREAERRFGSLGPFTPEELGVLAGVPFLGVESLILVGFEEKDLPTRSALRKIGDVLRQVEEAS